MMLSARDVKGCHGGSRGYGTWTQTRDHVKGRGAKVSCPIKGVVAQVPCSNGFRASIVTKV